MEINNNSRKKRIAIQGGYGAFHDIAAKYYFEGEDIDVLPCDTFKDLVKSIKEKDAVYGIMAIENTVAGSIIPNYALISNYEKKIVGEIYLRIKQNLIAMPGQKIEQIREVFSHPMALLQCQAFFEEYKYIKLIDSIDTALSVKEIKDKNLYGVGAIASSLAAEMYEMDILAESIETNKMNYTRFLILEDKDVPQQPNLNVNKSSINFSLANQIGGLSKILSILSYYDINLSKIQSLPIIGKEWEYMFYIDVEFDNYERYLQSLDAIRPFTGKLVILGEYEKGKKILQ